MNRPHAIPPRLPTQATPEGRGSGGGTYRKNPSVLSVEPRGVRPMAEWHPVFPLPKTPADSIR